MPDRILSLFDSAVRVSSLTEIELLPADTHSVHLDAIDDERAQALARLRSLRAIIHDGNSRLSDHGLAVLSSLTRLEALDLEWSANITDHGIKRLAQLRHLLYLDLGFCSRLSRDAVAELQTALPDCEIKR